MNVQTEATEPPRTLRALSIDGGGMRGYYTAEYLSTLGKHYAQEKGEGTLDLGGAFDLICGTSTGAILACALAQGIDLAEVAALYRHHGRRIFERRIPTTWWGLPGLLIGHRARLERGARALKDALSDLFGTTTVGEVWATRRIALAIPAVNMSHHRSWVFKTPHLPNSIHRDDDCSLVDVCLASTAAPIFRSMARTKNPSSSGYAVFVDGGLWANTPVLVALVDALQLAMSGDRLEIYCVGTSPVAAGESIRDERATHRSAFAWRFGADAANLAVTAQQYAFPEMARLLSTHVRVDCKVIKFPHIEVPANFESNFALDATDDVSLDVMRDQAYADANETWSRSRAHDDRDGQLLHTLFSGIPASQPHDDGPSSRTHGPSNPSKRPLPEGNHDA